MISIAALVVIVALSWAYVLGGAGMGMSAFDMSSLPMALGQAAGKPMAMSGGSMGGMTGAMQTMATPAGWTAGYAVLMFFMWWIMMIAMMLPSAAPTVLLYAVVNRKAAAQKGERARAWSMAAFTAGYLVAWVTFSLVATSLQWAFELAGLLSPMMLNSTSAALAGSILVVAGLYQLTPLKHACLQHCRGPIQFLSQHWRPGAFGALRMGLHHGAYCLGCCWGLMAILFFGGIMNLYWIIGLALVVLIEKLAPFGYRVGQALGLVLLTWGGWFLVAAATG
jgi:predicted metal-binding membrane protein